MSESEKQGNVKRGILIVFAVLLVSVVCAQGDDKLITFGKFKVEWGNLDGAKITLFEDGKQIDEIRPSSNGKFNFVLSLNHKYQFYFAKPNYVTKIVNFNTTVPASVTSDPDFIPFPDFDFYVTLFESYPEVDTMFFRNPVGKIQYNAKINNFDWDKEYTLEIIRRIEEIEEDIRKKREASEADKIRKVKEAEEKRIAEAEAKKEAEKQAKLDAERKKQDTKEQERLAKEAEKEKQRAQKEQEEKLAQEEKEKELEQKENERAQTELEKSQQEELANEEVKTPKEEKLTELLKKAPVEEKAIKEKQPEKVEETKSKQQKLPRQNTAQLRKPDSRPEVFQPKKKKIDITKQEVTGKKVTRITVQKGEIAHIYIKVEYSWGGRFFFIQDETNVFRNISESYYNIMTAKR